MLMMNFDLRLAPFSTNDAALHYRTAIEMTAFADEIGMDRVQVSEHHVTEDCYNPAPIAMLGAMVACTRRTTINVGALLLNLHHPVKVAEDLAVLDILSGGRVRATIGLGYREVEYQAFGADWAGRGKLMDQKLDMLLRALSGETVDCNGVPVRISPLPITPPRVLVALGGNSAAAGRRAARFGLLFFPGPPDLDKSIPAYYEEAKRLGFAGGFAGGPTTQGEPGFVRRANAVTFISEDPAQDWDLLEPYLAFEEQGYGAWGNDVMTSRGQAIRESGRYQILTPEQAVAVYKETGRMRLTPLAGGIPAAAGWRSLHLLRDKVLPHLDRPR